MRVRLAFLIAAVGWAAAARAETVTITVPADVTVKEAVATTGKATKTDVSGKVDGHTITFPDLKAKSVYDVRLTLADGTVLQGVNTGWYAMVDPAEAKADPLTDDDRQQMTAVVTQVLSFFKDKRVVTIVGTHDRAVMLVQQQRGDADGGVGQNIGDGGDFHSSKGEVVWRPELWYFENHHGGWEKVQQTDKVLRRERYASRAAYHAAVDGLKWVPELGGIKVAAGAGATVALPAGAGLAAVPTDRGTTRPTTRP